MNGYDFFTNEDFDRYVLAIKNETQIEWEKHEIKINGNTYSIDVHTGRYVDDDQYFISFFVNYNYKNEYGRSIGGGNTAIFVDKCENYDDFIKQVNNRLQTFPDFEKPEAIQMTLF